jgi:hypothetical protein
MVVIDVQRAIDFLTADGATAALRREHFFVFPDRQTELTAEVALTGDLGMLRVSTFAVGANAFGVLLLPLLDLRDGPLAVLCVALPSTDGKTGLAVASSTVPSAFRLVERVEGLQVPAFRASFHAGILAEGYDS